MSLRRHALMIAIGLIAGATLVPPSVAYAAKELQDVFVTNSPDEPIPVAGTVSVGNLPSTQPVSGTVSVNPTAPANTFSRRAHLSIGVNSGNTSCANCDDADLLDVPDGMVAVIEHVSMRLESTAEMIPTISLLTEGGSHFIAPGFLGTEASVAHPDHKQSRVYMASHPVRIVVPATSDPLFAHREVLADLHADLLSNSPSPYRADAIVRITGYLIDGNTALTLSDAMPGS